MYGDFDEIIIARSCIIVAVSGFPLDSHQQQVPSAARSKKKLNDQGFIGYEAKGLATDFSPPRI